MEGGLVSVLNLQILVDLLHEHCRVILVNSV